MQRITILTLAGLVACSLAVSSANATSVSGFEDGTATGVGGSESFIGSVGASSFGTITSYLASDTVVGTTVSSGSFSQDYAGGDLVGSYTGTFSSDGTTAGELLSFVVNGGLSSGVFAGASGTLMGLENITIATGAFQLTFQGSVVEVAATPLPSTLAMMLAGLAAVGFFAARKKSGFAAAEKSEFAAAA